MSLRNRTDNPYPPRAYYVSLFGRRRLLILAMLASGFAAYLWLAQTAIGQPRGESGWVGFVDFFSAALQPALTYESQSAVAPEWPLLMQVLRAASLSLAIAVASLSLALLFAFPLAYVVVKNNREATTTAGKTWSKLILGISGLLRSIHSLIWAVVFLIIFGFSPLAAIIAISLPTTGILIKIFSETLLETETQAADALRANGAPPMTQFLFGILPIAVADLVAYTLYQLECAVRSSAVMGVFGLPTLGYFILQSHENLYFREVWTYIYGLIILIIALEAWSRALRRRLRCL